MMSSRRWVAFAAFAATGVGLLSGCSSAGDKTAANGKTTITVASLIPGSTKEAVAAFNGRVTAFEKVHPDITVTPQEYQWTGPTFASQLAGGTLPTEFSVPFTDSQSLLQNGQLADITDQVKQLPYVSQFNKNVFGVAQDSSGKIFGLPYGPYAMGLSYNRAIFKKAGLDPDKPPTTWDEVRADAKTIAQKVPGVAGYMQMTQGGTGGWELTAATYSRGGRVQSTSGGKTTVTTDNPQTKAVLQQLHDMRWVDNSLGSNFLLDWSGINQRFGAGQIAMYPSGSDVLGALVQQDGVKPADYGLAPLPTEGTDAGVLSGGNVAAVSVKATPEQRAAAVKWIDFYYMQPLTDKAQAVSAGQGAGREQATGRCADAAGLQPGDVQPVAGVDQARGEHSAEQRCAVHREDLRRAGGPRAGEGVAAALRGAGLGGAGRPHQPERGHRRAAEGRRREDAACRRHGEVMTDPTGSCGRAGRIQPRSRPRGPVMAVTSRASTLRRKRHARRSVTGWVRGGGLSSLLFLLPMLFIFGLFSWYPIVRAVVMSFQTTNLVTAPTFVGFSNFVRVVNDPLFWTAVGNTGWFALLALVLGYPIPLVAAVLMSEVRRWKGLYSALAYLPVVVPPVVAVLLWKFFYDASPTGVFNTILAWAHLPPQPWIQNELQAMPSLVVEATWAAAGSTIIIYLAALTGVAPELYDAGEVDGASVWNKIWHITLPQLRGILLVTLILQIIGTAQVFLEPFLFTDGGPVNSTTTILLLIYNYAFQNSLGGDYGAATALSVLLAVFLAVLSLVYFRLTRSWS